MTNLSNIMKTAWAIFRKETQFWARPLDKSGAFSFAARFSKCLRKAWEEAKLADRAIAIRAAFDRRVQALASLTVEQKETIAVLKDAISDLIYLPQHMSMSGERAKLQARIDAIVGGA